ncbi:muscle-specific protein 300 kDa-like [Lineus longissimus]|uniref:muscle-specific protein 300 kDa-like n=1 Tax=Lineus longissimus TaxID=88925 RepID=UPI00315D4BD4
MDVGVACLLEREWRLWYSANNGQKSMERVRKELSVKLEEVSKKILVLKRTASPVLEVVGQHDQELVQDHLSEVDQKYQDLHATVQRKIMELELLASDYTSIVGELEKYLIWVKERHDQMDAYTPLGHRLSDRKAAFDDHQMLCQQVDDRQELLRMMVEKCEGLMKNISKNKGKQIRKKVKHVQDEHQKLYQRTRDVQHHLEVSLELCQKFHGFLKQIQDWCSEKEDAFKTEPSQLKSVGVEKQIEKYQSLSLEISSYEINLDMLKSQAQNLMDKMSKDGQVEVRKLISDVEGRYIKLKGEPQTVVGHLKEVLQNRKQFEADIRKVRQSLKETSAVFVDEINLGDPISVLEDQLNRHKVLFNAAKVMESVVMEIKSKACMFREELQKEDRLVLEEEVTELQTEFNSISTQLAARLQQLEYGLATRGQYDQDVDNCRKWLRSVRDEIKKLNIPCGCGVEDAQDKLNCYERIRSKIHDYQVEIDKVVNPQHELLIQSQESKREEIDKLHQQYVDLNQQVELLCQKANSGLKLRQQYCSQCTELVTMVTECENQIKEVEQSGTSLVMKIQKYKITLERSQAFDQELRALNDRGRQVAVEGSPVDKRTISDEVHSLKMRIQHLKRDVQKRLREYEAALDCREAFLLQIEETLNWLCGKKAEVQMEKTLPLDAGMMEREIRKHSAFSQEIHDHIEEVQSRIVQQQVQFEEMEESMPTEMRDKIDLVAHKAQVVKRMVEKRTVDLDCEKIDRVGFDDLFHLLNDWLKEADANLKAADGGVDFESAQQELDNHKAFFSEDSTRLDQLLFLSEKISPSLDTNDKATLREIVTHLNTRMTRVLATANRRTDSLQHYIVLYSEYKVALHEASDLVEMAEIRWGRVDVTPVTSLSHAHQQLTEVMDCIYDFNPKQDLIDDVNSKSQELQRIASSLCHDQLERLTRTVTERWRNICFEAEQQQEMLRKVTSRWQEYTNLARDLDQFITTAEEKLHGAAPVYRGPKQELITYLAAAETVCAECEERSGQLHDLRSSSQRIVALLSSPPTMENIEKDTEGLESRFADLQSKSTKQEEYIQTILSQQGALQVEIEDHIKWMKVTESDLATYAQIPLEEREVEDALNKVKPK